MSDSNNPPGATGASQPDEERRELIFKSDLNQVYLLLSFISGRPERNLLGLTLQNPDNSSEQWSYGKVVQELMQIQYPPKGPEAEIAKQATLLLMAKDRLSQLAWPARSDTIAYTAMFAEEMRHGFWTRLRSWLSSLRRKPAGSSTATLSDPSEPSLGRLARETFPHFEAHVRRFFIFRDFLFYIGLLLLFLTAQTSWDVAHGRDVLGRIDQLDRDWNTTLQANAQLADPNFCGHYWREQAALPGIAALAGGAPASPTASETPPSSSNQPAAPSRDSAGRGAPAPNTIDGNGATTTRETGNQNGDLGRLGCLQLANIINAREQAETDLDRIFGCNGAACKHVSSHALYWGWLLSGRPEPITPSSDTIVSREPPHHIISPKSANSVLTVFSGYILPLFYGLLGTIVGAFRSIQDKVRNGELGPRDLGLAFTGMMLGSVAGLVVGILMSPDSLAAGTGNALGNVTLTASGLAFLAGYASQSFFRFIDGIIAKIFPADVPETSANAAAPLASTQLPVVR